MVHIPLCYLIGWSMDMADFGLSTGVLCGGMGGGTSSSTPLPLIEGSPLFLWWSAMTFLDCFIGFSVVFSCMFVVVLSSLDNLVASLYTGGGGRWSRLVRFSADGVLPLVLLFLSPKDIINIRCLQIQFDQVWNFQISLFWKQKFQISLFENKSFHKFESSQKFSERDGQDWSDSWQMVSSR